MEKLTPKQKRFCEYYAVSLNGTEAAIKAGYSAKTARVMACENLTKPSVKAYLEKLTKESDADRKTTAEEVIQFFADGMRNEELYFKERRACAENLAKIQGLFLRTADQTDGTVDLKVSRRLVCLRIVQDYTTLKHRFSRLSKDSRLRTVQDYTTLKLERKADKARCSLRTVQDYTTLKLLRRSRKISRSLRTVQDYTTLKHLHNNYKEFFSLRTVQDYTTLKRGIFYKNDPACLRTVQDYTTLKP